ncbi:MAG: hypothetical protein IT338_07880, partial [Thermomicrobiales bacterium]|nr:hypothetical protein [Thermomicrobiales bacterium]
MTETRATNASSATAGAATLPASSNVNGNGAEPLLEVNNLVMHFPLTRGIIFQRKVGAVQAVDG